MKTILLLFISTPLWAITINCDKYFVKKLTPAELEAQYMKDIGKYTKSVDKLREAQGQILTQSAIKARNQVRILNSFLSTTSDPSLLYSQFKSMFFQSEASFLKLKNYQKRIRELKQLRELTDPSTARQEWVQKFEQYGLGELPVGKKELHKRIDEIVLGYENEILRSTKDLVKNYDNYLGVRYGLDEIINSADSSPELKAAALNAQKRLSLSQNDIDTYPYVFAEQRAGFQGIKYQEFKDLMDQNLELKKLIWQERKKQEILGLTQHVVLKARLHSKLLTYINQKIPTTNAFYKKLRQILARYTKDVTDYEMFTKYNGFISLQIAPSTTAKSLDDQMKLLLSSNAHSDPADQYLIAFARSVDGRIAWNNLKKHAASNEAYSDVLTRMQKAEDEARILGDMKIGKGGLIAANLPIYVVEVAAVWAAFEYFKVEGVNIEEIGVINPESPEAQQLEESLKQELSESELDQQPAIDTLGRKIQTEIDQAIAEGRAAEVP